MLASSDGSASAVGIKQINFHLIILFRYPKEASVAAFLATLTRQNDGEIVFQGGLAAPRYPCEIRSSSPEISRARQFEPGKKDTGDA